MSNYAIMNGLIIAVLAIFWLCWGGVRLARKWRRG